MRCSEPGASSTGVKPRGAAALLRSYHRCGLRRRDRTQDINQRTMTSYRFVQKGEILSALKIISTREHLLELCEAAAGEYSPAAMIRMIWKGSYLPDYVPFVKCFTPDELTELAQFHRFLEARINTLCDRQDPVQTFFESSDWPELVQQTNKTLERISTGTGLS